MTELRTQINKKKSFLPISTAIVAEQTRDPLKPNLNEEEVKDRITCHVSRDCCPFVQRFLCGVCTSFPCACISEFT